MLEDWLWTWLCSAGDWQLPVVQGELFNRCVTVHSPRDVVTVTRSAHRMAAKFRWIWSTCTKTIDILEELRGIGFIWKSNQLRGTLNEISNLNLNLLTIHKAVSKDTFYLLASSHACGSSVVFRGLVSCKKWHLENFLSEKWKIADCSRFWRTIRELLFKDFGVFLKATLSFS